jgi:hypothetical protein
LKLSKILQEITAAEKAHSLGYASAGYDKWQKDGKIVARTVDGKLVPVAGMKLDPADDPELKPTTTSAADAGKTKKNDVTSADAKKMAGGIKPKIDHDLDDDGIPNSMEIPHFAPRNPYGVKPFPVGRGMEDYELADEFAPAADPHHLLETLHPEEEPYIVTQEEWDAYFLCHPKKSGIDDRGEVVRMGKECAMKQKTEWRNKLPQDIQEDLIFIQGMWQETGQYKDDENAHAQRNSFFNLVANGKPPAVLKNVQFPLERGMTMPSSVATAFMSSLTIGEDIKLPPSGFSYNPLIARSFADNAVDDKVAVLVRLAPNRSAEVYGIDLSCVDVPKEMEDAESHQSEINSFSGEGEVIRTAGPKARCTSIRKLIRDPRTGFDSKIKVAYVIELEERGYEKDTLDEGRKKKKFVNPVFERIMNTSFGACAQSQIQPVQESKRARLKRLLEGKASEQAHKLNLKYKGHGYWVDQSGKTVAVTKNDKLLKLSRFDQDILGDLHNDGIHFNPNDGNEHYEYPDNTPPDSPKYGEPYGENVTKGDQHNIVFNKVKDATGTNPGGFYTGKDGIDRYVKFYDDPAKSCGEVLANNIYHDLGIDAPESQYFNSTGPGPGNTTAFASVIVPNVVGEVADVGLQPNVINGILKGFAADCLTANWDVLGVNEGFMRNMVVTKDGKVVRIDNGGSFLCKGLTGRKPTNVLNNCEELTQFVQNNPSYSKVFAKIGITHYSQLGDKLVKQVADILKLVTDAGGWEKYVMDKIPDLNADDRNQIIKMLYERTKILMDVAKDMQKGPNG